MVALDELAHACKDRSRSIARLECVLHPAPYGSYSDVRSQPERKPTHTERSTSSGMQQVSNIPDREPPTTRESPVAPLVIFFHPKVAGTHCPGLGRVMRKRSTVNVN